MKTKKNPVNFQGIIDRKLQKNKNKTKRCDRSRKKIIHPYNKQNKKTKQTKHTYNNITP